MTGPAETGTAAAENYEEIFDEWGIKQKVK